MKIVITGYTYTRENLFDVFESYPEKDNLFFILPGNWTAKNGTVQFPPFRRTGFAIWNSPAYFTHSQYPFIGGLMKGWMPFLSIRLGWLRLTQHVDILFTAGEPNLVSTLYNALWAKFFGMKHIFLYWENIPYEAKDKGLKMKLKKTLIRWNLALSDGAICGMHKAEDILKSFDTEIPVGTFLHAGFDEYRFRPGLPQTLREELKWQYKTIFLFVGALGYRKGIHLALRALAELSKTRDNLAMVIVGSGEYKAELEKLVGELELESQVHFIPWIANAKLPEIYNSSDIFLYPSIPYEGWEEQFGYSIAEASLCELPVISTDSGSIYEVLKNGETGYLIKPNDQSALMSAMAKLADDPDLRKSLGVRGRDFIVRNFSNKVIAQKLYKLFSEVAVR